MKKTKFQKIRQILALAGVAVILLLYLSTLIFAFIDKSQSKSLLTASIFTTFFVAFLLYAISLAAKLFQKDKHDDSQQK